MKILQVFIFLYALIYVIIGISLLQHSRDVSDWLLFLYFIGNAAVIILGTLFERSRYKSKSTQKEGWVPTKEQFIDHQSGKLVKVYFHPQSGERKYVEVK
jgi:hypothetical protein